MPTGKGNLMKKLIFATVACGFWMCDLTAAGISTIEELDDAALFSFSVISDNQGNSTNMAPIAKALEWIRSNNEFCIGNGDLFNGSGGDPFGDLLSDTNSWYHYNFYPVIGDHDNEIRIDGVRGQEKLWGRGHIIFDMVDDFYHRPNVEFRSPLDKKVVSGGAEYEDQYIDYYAKEAHGIFNMHIIAIHKGDKSALARRSADFMIGKVKELSSTKTDHDIIILVAHDEKWLHRGWVDWGVFTESEVDFLLDNTDLIICSSDHRFRRIHELDGRVANQALIVDSGQCKNRGGYLEIHMFDNPPRFTAQYLECKDESVRTLHSGAYQNLHILPERKETVELFHPMMKEINGPITQPLDWSCFDPQEKAKGKNRENDE